MLETRRTKTNFDIKKIIRLKEKQENAAFKKTKTIKGDTIIRMVTMCPCKYRPMILVVDDNLFNIMAIQLILEEEY